MFISVPCEPHAQLSVNSQRIPQRVCAPSSCRPGKVLLRVHSRAKAATAYYCLELCTKIFEAVTYSRLLLIADATRLAQRVLTTSVDRQRMQITSRLDLPHRRLETADDTGRRRCVCV